MNPIIICLAALILAVTCCPAAKKPIAAPAPVLLNANFETDPLADGWSFPGINADNWQNTTGRQGGHCLFTKGGTWDSPMISVTPYNYYKCTFWTKATRSATPDVYPAVWSAVCFDANMKPLVSDHYWGIDLSDDWVKHEYVTYAKANSVKMNFHFQPYALTSLMIDDVSVEQITYQQAASWVDSMYAQLPQFKFTAAKDRWALIPKTMKALKKGGTLKIVMLGDSICNDTGNSSWHALVQRKYPKTKLDVVISVRGGTGVDYYQRDNHVKEYVIDYKPDLLIIAGISQGNDPEALRSVIKQVRAVINPEIIFMTPVVGAGDPSKPDETKEKFIAGCAQVCKEEKVEFIDMFTPWKNYISASGKPFEWFHRDPVHANVRGAMVLAKIVEVYFAPKK